MKELLEAVLNKKPDFISIDTFGQYHTTLILYYGKVKIEIRPKIFGYKVDVYKIDKAGMDLQGAFTLRLTDNPQCCDMCKTLMDRHFSKEVQEHKCAELAKTITVS